MARISLRKPRKRTAIAVITAISVFLILYLGGAIHDASKRYERASKISNNRAHTRVGIEGYEYIFEPNTQIFIDKILPNKNIIITHIVLRDYLPFNVITGCKNMNQDICTWMQVNILYFHEPAPVILEMILYAAITAFFTGVGFYRLMKD